MRPNAHMSRLRRVRIMPTRSGFVAMLQRWRRLSTNHEQSQRRDRIYCYASKTLETRREYKKGLENAAKVARCDSLWTTRAVRIQRTNRFFLFVYGVRALLSMLQWLTSPEHRSSIGIFAVTKPPPKCHAPRTCAGWLGRLLCVCVCHTRAIGRDAQNRTKL